MASRSEELNYQWPQLSEVEQQAVLLFVQILRRLDRLEGLMLEHRPQPARLQVIKPSTNQTSDRAAASQ